MAASRFVNSLNSEHIRFGLYKNISSVYDGIVGISDLDIIVHSEDKSRCQAILKSLSGVRGAPHPFYDNAVTDREDWFILDSSGTLLHLDISFGLRIGRKFRKRYLALDYGDIDNWLILDARAPALKFVASQEEARIAVLRSIFSLPLWHFGKWVRIERECEHLLKRAFSDGQDSVNFVFRLGEQKATCLVRRSGDRFEAEQHSVRRLRAMVLARCGFGKFAATGDFIVHHAKRAIFSLARQLTRASPARTVTKRSIRPDGFIVALIGSDGVGKSTQAARLTAFFQRKFRCTSVYLGSNDGSWMRYVHLVRSRFAQGRPAGASSAAAVRPKSANRGRLHRMRSAVWRLAIALQRYAALRRARRLSRSGAIVITDRWPQALQCGFLDGPSVPPPRELRFAHFLSRIEQRLYRRMAKYRPHLTIHLDCDFETSDARKPGERTPEEFQDRISLMERMRILDPAIRVIDARQEMDQVTHALLQCIWAALSAHAAQGKYPVDTATSR